MGPRPIGRRAAATRGPATGLVAIALATIALTTIALGCSGPTSVRLIVGADPGVRARAASIRVSVSAGQGGDRTEYRETRSVADVGWPAEVVAVPRSDEDGRAVTFTVSALDAAGAVVSRGAATIAFAHGEQREERLVLTTACAGAPCAPIRGGTPDASVASVPDAGADPAPPTPDAGARPPTGDAAASPPADPPDAGAPSAPACAPQPETCDGRDEDCDGRADESLARSCGRERRDRDGRHHTDEHHTDDEHADDEPTDDAACRQRCVDGAWGRCERDDGERCR